MDNVVVLGSIAVLSLMLTGCAESATMIGNGATMIVTCVLLWSTVNLGEPESGD